MQQMKAWDPEMMAGMALVAVFVGIKMLTLIL